MKDILVYCDGTGDDTQRLVAVTQLGKRFDAHVECVLALSLPLPVIVPGGMGAAAVAADDTTRKEAIAQAEDDLAGFKGRLAAEFPNVALNSFIDTNEYVTRSIAELSRTFDVFVTSSPADGGADLREAILDSVLKHGGAGILVLPSSGNSDLRFERVLIAWNGSREASRAISLSMSLIQNADEVSVLLIDPPLRQAGTTDRPGDELVRHLEHHGVSSKLFRATSGDMDISEAILAEAQKMGSNLLVTGAQAEGGLFQWLRGSVSRKLLNAVSVPLFVAQ